MNDRTMRRVTRDPITKRTVCVDEVRRGDLCVMVRVRNPLFWLRYWSKCALRKLRGKPEPRRHTLEMAE